MSILIPCPQCGRELKLPDRNLLGRKGRCPKCSHTFVLQESPVQVCDLPKPNSVKAEKPVEKMDSANDDRSKSLPHNNPPQKEIEPTFELSIDPTQSTVSSLGFPTDFASLGQIDSSTTAMARRKDLKRRKAQRRNIGLIVAAIVGCFVIVIAVLLSRADGKKLPAKPRDTAAEQVESPATKEGQNDSVVGDDSLDPSRNEFAKMGLPTSGKPIDLQYIPFGTQVVINLHPAEMWRNQGLSELRECVPPLASLIEATIQELFRGSPDEIEELLICLIPGARGTPPGVAAVAHLSKERERDRWIEQLGLRTDADRDSVYVAGQHVYLIADSKTLVVCPRDQADEMFKAIEGRHPAEQFDQLLPLTDRDRHVTVMLTPVVISLQESWVAESVRPLVKGSLDWLGADIETVSWSFHLTDELFHSEILLRTTKGPAKKIKTPFQTKLAETAGTLVPLIQQMDPQEQGKRMVIGRLPAMIEVYSMATIFDDGPRHLRLTTPLPSRAATNIFLGTFLAWDESLRTDFSQAKPIPADGPTLPATVAERLAMTIDVDFRASPFSEAFVFISGEISTPIELDGDALKAGGFTKNLKQTFRMDAAPVKAVIARIFFESKGVEINPEKRLVVVVDEVEKKLLITTLAVADKRGLKAAELE